VSLLPIKDPVTGMAHVVGASAVAPDPLARLAKLANLHTAGALTDAEFAAQKAKILESM
jgi:hypothetical protein